MRTLLDANAALRYLLEDLPEQAEIVAQAIADGAEITPEVIAEVVYVLDGVYSVPRSRAAESLELLLGEVRCTRGAVVSAALGYYVGSKLDFVDCLMAAEHSLTGRPVLTFDDGLRELLARE